MANKFPPGYTQEDQDRHERALRNIALFSKIAIGLIIAAPIVGIIWGISIREG